MSWVHGKYLDRVLAKTVMISACWCLGVGREGGREGRVGVAQGTLGQCFMTL